jgi:hypothetical protein
VLLSGDDSVTGDPGDDVIYPGDGKDKIYAEEGTNHVIATDDGVRDEIFCSLKNDPSQPDGLLTYVGDIDPLDHVRRCTVEQVPASRAAGILP